MAANKNIRIGPVALTTTLTTNILNPQTLTGGVSAGGTTNAATYLLLRHIRIANKTASTATFSLWIGATGGNAAGTEFMGTAQSVPANSYVDWFGGLRLDAADFLVGGSGTATALTFEAEGEIGVA
jgi:hypothetical protein